MTQGPNYSSMWTPAAPPLPTRATSRTEVIHIVIAFLVLTFDLVIILNGRGLLVGAGSTSLFAPVPLSLFLLALAAALTGFIAHEMAHKLAARRLGYWAEFRMWPFGLILSVVTSLSGVLFAAPGATMVSGMAPSDRENWGRTGVAGPISNLLFAAGFYAAALGSFRFSSTTSNALLFLAMINTLFATFNLLPLGPLDGAKVLRWGPGRWVMAFVVAAAFLGLTSVALGYYGSPFLAW